VSALEVILFLLAVSAGLQVAARRWHIPHPALLVVGGAVLAVTPGLPRVELDPDTAFLVFIPPLLYWTALTTSLREFKRGLWLMGRLGVFLVLVSMAVVALVGHALSPELTWPAAFVLGAIVAPPDPVAATAVLRSVDAPPSLANVLEGEGLINDATALVAYRVAVGAAVTGAFSPAGAALQIVVAGAAGIAIGLCAGWLIARVRRYVRGVPVVGNTISLLTPFIAYLPADRVGASGVLAVVAVALYLGDKGAAATPPATRVQAEAMWAMLTFVLESLIFVLIGLELPDAVRALGTHSLPALIGLGAAVAAALVVCRLLWVFPSAYLPHLTRHVHRHPAPPWRWVAFIGWAGVRGGDSLVIALALPLTTAAGTPFPARDLILFVTFAVIFATLVVQGLTLAPALRLLGLRGGAADDGEEAHARRVMAEAALRALDTDDGHPTALRALRRTYGAKARYWGARDRTGHARDDADHARLDAALADTDLADAAKESDDFLRLRLRAIQAERAAIIQLRDQEVIGGDVLLRVQRDLDFQTMLVEGADDEAPESPYLG
jgi:CPA1 family monovalent cation:H+ antiporter